MAFVAATLLLAPTPSLAQSSGSQSQSAGTIGPAELKNFSLGKGGGAGLTVTPPPATTPPPASTQATPSLGDVATPSPRSVFSTRIGSDLPARSSPQVAARRTEPAPRPEATVNAPAAPAAAPSSPNSSPLGTDLPVTAAASAPTPIEPTGSFGPTASGSLGIWPWLLALVAAVGIGIVFWGLRRRTPQVAMAGVRLGDLAQPRVPEPSPGPRPSPQPQSAPSPHPSPMPRAMQPSAAPAPRHDPVPPAGTPAPAPSSSLLGGIVARTLQPKIAFEFQPIRVDYDAEGRATLLFDLTITNTGHAPARDVLVEGKMFNAGPRQDEEIAAFFLNPRGMGERISFLPPTEKLLLRSRVALTGDDVRPVGYEGRQLFVPLVGFNALYRGPSGEQKDSASYLVGRGGQDGGKMGAFPLDQGARGWTEVSARPHSAGLSS
ncbi:hypothetical protein ABDK56_05795 [Sphingomonas sp. ASV193]|uniref:hypothetical protein n=1 Tax=Sphingomonas sp. ASV193 TaxID=3144405 RepID=UPI0032E8E936